MMSTDEPDLLFEPEPDSESIQSHSLEDDSQPTTALKCVAEQEETDSLKQSSDIQDDNSSTINFGDTRDTTIDSTSSTMEEVKIVDVEGTTVVNSNDFQKVMDSMNEPTLHDDKLLDFVSNLGEDHPSSQSLDEKLLDSVVEHETPEETMQVERLMESIHNEKSSIVDSVNSDTALGFDKIDDSQVSEEFVGEDVLKDKEIDSSPMITDSDTAVITDIRSLDTKISASDKSDDITEQFLSGVEDIVGSEPAVVPEEDKTVEDIPVYDTTVDDDKSDEKIFEAKDCLQKAMEAINMPSSEVGEHSTATENEAASSVEDVLSALHSEVSAKEVKISKDDNSTSSSSSSASNGNNSNVSSVSETKSQSSLAASSGKRVAKESKQQESSPPQCFVTGCESGKTDSEETKRYFKPPPNPLIFKRWAHNLCQGSQTLSFNSRICERHFRPSEIREVFVNGKKKWVLNEGALPKIQSNKSTAFQSFIARKKTDDTKKLMNRVKSLYKPSNPPSKPSTPADSDKKTAAELLSALTEDDTENIDPSVLSYNTGAVRQAQEEITTLDVLVCGLCHTVFHFIEELQAHKLNVNCRGTSTFKASLSEPKPQVWAFLLWKNAQTKMIGDTESSWKLYQRWCKMPEQFRDTWIAAGKALQVDSVHGHQKITDVTTSKPGRPKTVSDQVDDEEDEMEPMDLDLDEGGAGDSLKTPKKERSVRFLPKEEHSSKIETVIDKIEEKMDIKSEPTHSTVPSLPHGETQEEFVVEKIVSRRFNQKKRQYEYLLKWEGYPPEQNTWEPEENMSTCRHLLKEFEANLAKQQSKFSAAAASSKSATPNAVQLTPSQRKATAHLDSMSMTPVTSAGRPVRSSKQKALDQVKVWCGSMIKTPDNEFPGKRRLSDIDSDEDDMVISKRIKQEQDSEEDSEDEVSRRPLRRFMGGRGGKQEVRKGRPPMNGIKKESNLAAALGLESSGEESPDRSPSANTSKPLIRNMSSLSPQKQKVLVASAKGVVKVDPSQVPNLTSGVYIMSNKSGIVKLDSMTANSAINTFNKKGLVKTTSDKPGVILLDNKPGSVTQKSGIIRRVQSTTSSSTPTTTSTSPSGDTSVTSATGSSSSSTITVTSSQRVKGSFVGSTSSVGGKVVGSNVTVTPTRPPGILRPLRPGNSPRPVGMLRPTTAPRFSSGIASKAGQLRLGGGRTGTPQARPRAPLGNLLKSGIKPIESILGSAGQGTQRILMTKKKSESEDGSDDTKSGIVKLNQVKKILGGTPRGGRGGRGFGRLTRGGRSSLSSLIGMAMDEEDKLGSKDENETFLDDQGHSSESDDGIADEFPQDLPPIQPDSPPRPLTLCPLTGKVLLKAEGEKTPEPTPPPSPVSEKVVVTEESSSASRQSSKDEALSQNTETLIVSTTPATTVNNSSSETGSTSVTVKRIGAGNARGSRRGSGSSAANTTASAASSTAIGTITVPARKMFHQTTSAATVTTSSSAVTVTATEAVTADEQDVVTITGDDGLLYQVSNADVSGNTLLVSSGEGQQCVYVTTDGSGEGDGDGTTSAVLTLDSAYADAVAQLIPEQFYVKDEDGGELVSLEEATEDGTVVTTSDDQSSQVVAQLVEAGEPAPGGGPRRVVLLLPDGNLMMTEVDEEQYAALELDK